MDIFSEENLKNARVGKWYDELAQSVDKCVFCDLREKYVVAKKGGSVLTVSLFPYIDGQLMVITKRHIERFDEMLVTEWREAKFLLDVGIRLIREMVGIDGINVLYREGEGAGKSVGHLHFHLLPITSEFMTYDKNVGFVWKFQQITVSPVEMAERMREHLLAGGTG